MRANINQITKEIMSLLINNLHGKGITESQDRWNFDSADMLFVLCTNVTTLHMKNTLVFSQSEACNFLVYY